MCHSLAAVAAVTATSRGLSRDSSRSLSEAQIAAVVELVSLHSAMREFRCELIVKTNALGFALSCWAGSSAVLYIVLSFVVFAIFYGEM